MDNATRKGKATHQGHCQACGRLQMLPNGLLSLHGYTVTNGYFSGVCRGAKEHPFEKSCGLVKLFIEGAKNALTSLEAFQVELRRPATEAKAWIRVSKANRRGRHYSDTREWALVDVTMETVPFSDGSGSYNKFFYDGDTCWKQNEIVPRRSELSHSHDKSLLQICTSLNEIYARWLEHEADSLRRYIAWQTERVRTWKEADLIPVQGTTVKDDKMGFKPTEAAY